MNTTKPDAVFQLADASNGFWPRYTNLVRNTVIPYQWAALNDRVAGAQPSHAIRNFRVAAGLESGEFVGMVFQDSDIGKWIEAVANALQTRLDAALETLVDETGDNLSALSLDVASGFEIREVPELLPGAVKILARGWRRPEQGWGADSYRVARVTAAAGEAVELVAVPYHLWGNRGPGEMRVWVRRHDGSRSDVA